MRLAAWRYGRDLIGSVRLVRKSKVEHPVRGHKPSKSRIRPGLKCEAAPLAHRLERRLHGQFANRIPRRIGQNDSPHSEIVGPPVSLVKRGADDLENEVGLLLAAPRVERRALPASQWKRTARRLNLEPGDEFDDNRTEVETWTYDPAILSRGNLVDPLSLYLSVRDSSDERMQQAARSVLEQPSW